ncbi:copper-translocating P-type ATPase [Hydrogenimonas cancrithermarum]|uniref:Copper-transporting ATPase n=1 Tax=Hydrogenimonas cancrithermarum TaxID=2993563 RepID=A0ABM8FMY2_9BACT|nr:copper-translocating P-type ATPase [Hydrogenimonas cancrithermarum]BDY13729.1 heavy metal translocating P-type ATPase [Hydrogenimonas cancrithermarum]
MKHDHEHHNGDGDANMHDHTTMGHIHHMEDMKRRFIVSVIVTVPILLLSPMIQAWFGFTLDVPYREAVVFILSTFIYLYGGKPFLTMTVDEIKSRKPGMMTLISMAISVAYFYSAMTLVMPDGKAFFWELATLIDIMLIGHYIEAKSVLGAADALQDLVKMMPKTAMRVAKDGTLEEVTVDALEKGDTILVRPGEKVPADGEVREGESMTDEAFLTGESKPIYKKPGSRVYMGSTNLDGALRITITKSGKESYLSQVIALVEEAQRSRSHTQDLANRAAGWLFYAATGVGAVTFAVWSAIASPMDAVLRSVTVLIIACPHALGLAVPLVVAITTSMAAKRGILIRNRQAFETLKSAGAICFDKTGTITEGKLAVHEVVAPESEAALLRYAVSIEQNSEHIIAKSIMAYAKSKGVEPQKAKNFTAYPGIGAKAIVEGHTVMVGGPQLLNKEALQLPETLRQYETSESTKVWVAVDGKVIGVILLTDTIRETSVEAIKALQSLGIETWMLTGDNEAVAKEVAKACGIDHYQADLLPDQKLNIIKQIHDEGKIVAMVGDGINDAPSLLTADIGIAIGAGTDIAIESADIILTKSDLMSVVHAIRLSRATYKKMVQNLWWASGYNIVAIPLAAGVMAPWGIVVDPAVGAVLMSVSTVVVALNAQLLKRAP